MPEKRFYWTDSADLDDLDAIPLVRLCDEDRGVLAWTTPGGAENLSSLLNVVDEIVAAKDEGGDLLGLVDMLSDLLRE